MSSARTRVTRVRASVRIQRMVKMRELAREVRDSERTDERRPPPPAHRPSATQPILCHLKQKARFPLLVFHLQQQQQQQQQYRHHRRRSRRRNECHSSDAQTKAIPASAIFPLHRRTVILNKRPSPGAHTRHKSFNIIYPTFFSTFIHLTRRCPEGKSKRDGR